VRRILLTLVPLISLATGIGVLGSAAAGAAPASSTTGATIDGPVPVQPFCVDVIVPVGPDNLGATVCTPWD
jgi:hypothetical protein